MQVFVREHDTMIAATVQCDDEIEGLATDGSVL
jgi:hypothetical protein